MVSIVMAVAIGAALAIGISAFGSALGIGIAGSAAAGAVAEDPDNFRNSLILESLPMTQTIYGFIIAFLILFAAGAIPGGATEIMSTLGEGAEVKALIILGAGLGVGLAQLSAIGQGITTSSGIGSTAKDSDTLAQNVIFGVLPETAAIFGFVIGIMMLVLGVGL